MTFLEFLGSMQYFVECFQLRNENAQYVESPDTRGLRPGKRTLSKRLFDRQA
jgi:hypothetical protein